jgi:peroxiredoxin Q/BCP
MLGPKDFAGRKLVIYFYPKDDTAGCTTEALGFTAKLAEFEAANTAIVGISKDSVKSHERFCRKHSLGIPLLSDETGAVVESFGSWIEKSMYGRKYMGIDRSTFLIGPDGIVLKVWRRVSVRNHVDAVLAAAQAVE